MTDFPANNLSITNQTIGSGAPGQGTITVDFSWIRGTSNSGASITGQQFILTSIRNNTICAQSTVVCPPTQPTWTAFTLGQLQQDHDYWFLIRTTFSDAPLSPIDSIVFGFHTITNQVVPKPPVYSPLPPFPQILPNAIYTPLPPFPQILNGAKVSPIDARPADTGGGGVNPGGGGGNGGTSVQGDILNAIWAASGENGFSGGRVGDSLALEIAIAYVESVGLHSDACGDCNINCPESSVCIGSVSNAWTPCAGQIATSWGLFQLHQCGGQGSGHPRDFLLNPVNNANIGVPPIRQAVINNVGINARDYTNVQLAHILEDSGHPGFISSNINEVLADSRIIAFTEKYNQMKYTIRETNFPVSGTIIL